MKKKVLSLLRLVWYRYTLPIELREMLEGFKMRVEEKHISNFWTNLNNNHISTLAHHGYDNFKHTVAQSYFTWLKKREDSQTQFLMDHTDKSEIKWAYDLARRLPVFRYLGIENSRSFNMMTLLLWKYVEGQGLKSELDKLAEPMEGNPPAINFEGRPISQDIANSLLEFDTIARHTIPGSVQTVLEIGAGYGRDAYAWMRLGAARRYIIVDIPPALYISQRYLMSQFPEKKTLRYRDFKTFEEIEKEFEDAALVFLAPWQLDLLPDYSVDMSCAIDSIHEMRIDTIRSYLRSVDRVTKKYFYMKCWKETFNSADGVLLKRGEYPIPERWAEIVNRECRVQTKYFEALYDLSRIYRL